MDTEPVKTTMRGIQAWVLGLEALGFALLTLASEVLKMLGYAELPASFVAAVMGLLATIVVVYSTQVGGTRLRDKVTPYSNEIGAMTPAPPIGGDARVVDNLPGG